MDGSPWEIVHKLETENAKLREALEDAWIDGYEQGVESSDGYLKTGSFNDWLAKAALGDDDE